MCLNGALFLSRLECYVQCPVIALTFGKDYLPTRNPQFVLANAFGSGWLIHLYEYEHMQQLPQHLLWLCACLAVTGRKPIKEQLSMYGLSTVGVFQL